MTLHYITHLYVSTEKQFEAAMTAAEKAKLFQAIGYQENDIPTELPEHYISQMLQFELRSLEVSIKSNVSQDSKDIHRIMLLELKNVAFNIEQRPSAAAVK